MLGPIRRIDEGPPVANSPDSAAASQTPPAVTPDTTTPPPVACETTTEGAAEIQGESESESPTTLPLSIVPPPVTLAEDVEKAPLSRRARKVLQQRLRQSAHRQAGEKSL